MEDITILKKIGLTKNERNVYLSLLEIGSSTVSDLVKKVGLHRSYIYDILEKLIDLGLTDFIIKNNKKYFESGNPERILEIIREREEKIKEDKKEINKILPDLKKRQKIAIEKQEAKVFLGKEGIKSILEDILRVKKDFIGFGAEGKFEEIFKWYFNNWQIRRNKLKLKYKVLYNEKLKGKRPVKEQKNVEFRFLPEKYDFPSTTIIYGENTAIIIWDINPIGFVLKSKGAAKTFTNSFELLWKIAKK